MGKRFRNCEVSGLIISLSALSKCLSPVTVVRPEGQTLLLQGTTDKALAAFTVPVVVISPLTVGKADHPLLAQAVLSLPVQTMEVRGGVTVTCVAPGLSSWALE